MKFKDFYLPFGLIFAFVLGFIFTQEGTYLFNWNWHSFKLSQFIIFLVFLVSGYLLKLDDFKMNRHLIYSLFGGLTINLFLAPCFALLIMIFLPLENALRLGVLTIACVPPTMASGIISTNVAKGNTAWAIIFTIFISAVGVFVIPFTFSQTIQMNATSSIDTLKIFKTLILLVLLPTILGYGIKRKWGDSQHPLLFYFQPTAIIFIAFCTIAAGKKDFSNLNVSIVITLMVVVLLLHGLLFSSCLVFSKLKKLKKEESIALTFVCSQKTLPLALSLLLIFPPEIATIATISCLFYHLTQIFIDSFLAYLWQKNTAKNQTAS